MMVLALLLTLAWQPEATLKSALDAHQKGDLDGAVKLYREFLKARPASFEAHSNLGAILARQGLYPDAIAEYKSAIRLAPGNPSIAFNLAIAYYKSGDIGQAAAELTKLPPNPRVTLLLADCSLRRVGSRLRSMSAPVLRSAFTRKTERKSLPMFPFNWTHYRT